MLKYVDTQVVFREIPNEITLAINISNCPHKCKGCHSPYLQEDTGKTLDWGALNALIYINHGITCVCFMGGDASIEEINKLAQHIRSSFPHLLIAIYSGNDKVPEKLNTKYFDFIKVGHYDKEKGPLNSKTTNQSLWKLTRTKGCNIVRWENITSLFW